MIIKANNLATNILNMTDKPKLGTGGILKKLFEGKIEELFIIDPPPSLSKAMQGRIRELNIKARYAQEGVAIAQTAQEGLERIQIKLDRMKELVASAAQDIYTDEDRQKIQAEINDINQAINNIAKGTNYKGHNLLATDDPDGQEALASETEDIVAELLAQMGRKSVTAEALGTDKVDVSSADSAAKGLKIVEGAMKTIKDELKRYKEQEMEFAGALEASFPEDESSLFNKPTMIISAVELIKYNLLNCEAHIILENSSQEPDKVMSLLNN